MLHRPVTVLGLLATDFGPGCYDHFNHDHLDVVPKTYIYNYIYIYIILYPIRKGLKTKGSTPDIFRPERSRHAISWLEI